MTLNIYIETYGCQMNEYDSELVGSILSGNGFALTKTADNADVVLLNTCAVRENAHLRIYGRLQELKKIKAARRRGFTVGILGCMAQNLREELLDAHHEIDFIAGPDSYRQLPAMIEAARAGAAKGAALKLSRTETYGGVNPLRSSGVNAWIAVMRGCDNMCSFCVVPLARGRERSRDPHGIVEEARVLAAEGYKQAFLLGQNVNSYRHGECGFADLARMVADIDGIERVRFTAPHPKDFPDDLLDLVAGHPKMCKHVHLPLQAGNNRVLDLMKRTYTIEEFKDLAAKMRSRIPGIALTTDAIVGFPGETDAEFEDTFKAMEEIAFDAAFIFKYSERKGTYAAKHFKDDVPAEKKTERIVLLVELQKKITGEINKRLVGQVFDVLAEGALPKYPGCLTGRTDTFKTTVFQNDGYARGDMVRVRIDRAKGGTLFGSAVGKSGGKQEERVRL
ncbi:MAG: tRNA (N6-isopentenyl adenosine(37)-C2)-methylthiotransferase MiaB [Chitinivibrionia bacterium]|nr:tRNA (N6-isopentenyl adenosine(37)-C2)-methylthiotransferase MiaB [Chitinivibrionia bacterium]